MSHRIIIDRAVQATVQNPEVMAQLTSNQCTRVTAICSSQTQPPCDDDMRFLLRCLDRAYAQDD